MLLCIKDILLPSFFVSSYMKENYQMNFFQMYKISSTKIQQFDQNHIGSKWKSLDYNVYYSGYEFSFLWIIKIQEFWIWNQRASYLWGLMKSWKRSVSEAARRSPGIVFWYFYTPFYIQGYSYTDKCVQMEENQINMYYHFLQFYIDFSLWMETNDWCNDEEFQLWFHLCIPASFKMAWQSPL